MNNTAGTNGGAVMVSGNINIEESIIMNNEGNETGGSFYIQQPMYNTKTVINVHNNLITNNTSPYGQEVFIKWWNPENLYTQFDNNDWGDENPNDSSVIDPNNVTSRSKVSSTIKSNLFAKLNVDLLTKYADLIDDFFQDNSLENLKKQFDDAKASQKNNDKKQLNNNNAKIPTNSSDDSDIHTKNLKTNQADSNEKLINGDSSDVGENNKNAYEINKINSASKEINLDIRYFIIALAIVLLLLSIGYRNYKKKE